MSRPSKDLKSEYITIAELSKLVGKSNQSIYKKMKQKPSFNQYIRIFDGKKYVHKSAVWEEFGVEIEGFKPVEDKGLENTQPDDQLISVLTDRINSQKQQIEAMQRTIDSLGEMLKAEQLLHGQTAARLQQATLLIEELRKQPEQPKQTADPERSAQPDGSPHQEQPDQTQDQSDQEQPGDNRSSDQDQSDHDNGSSDQTQENHDNESSDQGQEQPERLTFLQRLKRFLGL